MWNRNFIKIKWNVFGFGGDVVTRALHSLPGLGDLREAAGQWLHQSPERRVGHHHHLLPLCLCEERLQHLIGRLVGTGAPDRREEFKTTRERQVEGQRGKKKGVGEAYLAVEEVVVEHVVEAELILAVELGVSGSRDSATDWGWISVAGVSNVTFFFKCIQKGISWL